VPFQELVIQIISFANLPFLSSFAFLKHGNDLLFTDKYCTASVSPTTFSVSAGRSGSVALLNEAKRLGITVVPWLVLSSAASCGKLEIIKYYKTKKLEKDFALVQSITHAAFRTFRLPVLTYLRDENLAVFSGNPEISLADNFIDLLCYEMDSQMVNEFDRNIEAMDTVHFLFPDPTSFPSFLLSLFASLPDSPP